jgi:hypothetical protein
MNKANEDGEGENLKEEAVTASTSQPVDHMK